MSCQANRGDSDFDKVCLVFENYQKNPSSYPSDKIMQTMRIAEEVQKVLKTEEAKNSWKALAHADLDQKYSLFKAGAEMTLKAKWNCSAMKNYFSPVKEGDRSCPQIFEERKGMGFLDKSCQDDVDCLVYQAGGCGSCATKSKPNDELGAKMNQNYNEGIKLGCYPQPSCLPATCVCHNTKCTIKFKKIRTP